ncbi:hypothetical protein [Proteus mirabilis]
MNGITGLDYNPLNQVMELLNIKNKALEVIHKRT